jgi:hypothetical protein
MGLRFWGRTPLLFGAVVVLLAVTGGAGSAGEGGPDPAQALRPGRGACGHLFEIVLPAGGVMCTHGPDPAPTGIDYTKPFDPAKPRRVGLLFPEPQMAGAGTPASASGPPRARCYGDGTSGDRVQAVYARPANHPDRYAQVVGSIQQWAADMDAVFQASADKTGSVRHVRFVTDPGCNVIVDNVVLSNNGADNLEATTTELAAKGYNRFDRKYVVWMDATELCGIAAYYIDENPGQSNFNNGVTGVPGPVARIDSGCWGLASQGGSVEAHELMHSLGAVMPGAPHASPAGHCDDGSDRMCYLDGTVVTLLSICPTPAGAIFDCGDDDYFNPRPPAGSYLAQNWNSANSAFLATTDGTPKLTINDLRRREGNSGTTDFVFTVSLDIPSSIAVSVDYATANGSAAAGEDYIPSSGTVTISPGQTQGQIVVQVKGDTEKERDETFFVNLSRPVNALLVDNQAVGVIADDDSVRLGYWFVATDGGIFAYGEAPFYGSTGNLKLNRPVYAMAATPGGGGYWMVADDGGIFAFGDARFFGSTGGQKIPHPIIGMATTPTGEGYWLAGSGGEIYTFGNAPDLGPLPPLSAPIVAISATPTGNGFWLVGSDGRVYTKGDAVNYGSVGGTRDPVVGIAGTPTGAGYWVATRGGRLYAFGDAPGKGSTPPPRLPIVGIASSPSGQGYWMCASDGGIFAFGDAPFLGSTGNLKLNKPVVGMSPVG